MEEAQSAHQKKENLLNGVKNKQNKKEARDSLKYINFGRDYYKQGQKQRKILHHS